MRSKTGQSVLEYVIVLTAIIAAVIAGAVILGRRTNEGGLGRLMNMSANRIINAADSIETIATR